MFKTGWSIWRVQAESQRDQGEPVVRGQTVSGNLFIVIIFLIILLLRVASMNNKRATGCMPPSPPCQRTENKGSHYVDQNPQCRTVSSI